MRIRFLIPGLAPVVLVASLAGADHKPDEEKEISWPQTLVVGADQAVVCNNHLFLEGDTLTFSLRADTLWCNGLVWRSYTLPVKRPPTTDRERWSQELQARYEADTTGTSQERIERALVGMVDGVLDPTSVKVSEIRLDARFLDGVGLIMYFEDPMPVVPEEAAASAVSSLQKNLARADPYVLVNYPGRAYSRGDVRIVRAFERARRGKLSAADRALARGNYILEAMEAVYERAKSAGD